ncbi:LIP-domain-containing protein [Teratosphaeria nubilosa]|uniref:LIP-domain-containing protein n=1 Tax=Teratosphaeria nubilosa TaxID=161662 RepID=A0A6G1L8W7_9PEZI|nr:LIP-domain-containing protein [Teratosphaeria nubilosa]
MHFSGYLAACAALLTGASAITPNSMQYRVSKATINSSNQAVLPPKQDPWYTAPIGFESAAPAAVLKVRVAPGNLTQITTNSSMAYNILYRSTDSQYKPTWAVTTLFVPKSPVVQTNTSQANILLSYQIPYDSVDLDASPSYALYANTFSDISKALGQGWYVNVPDYEGPKASFTAGVNSGHCTLDSVRAVLNSDFGLSQQTKYAMWGYSGGALASEWAAELQVQYAPELNFTTAALGGLTPNITSVLESISGTVAAGLAPAGIVGLSTQWPDLAQLLQDDVKANMSEMLFSVVNETLTESLLSFLFRDITSYFVNGVEDLLKPAAVMPQDRDGQMGFHGFPQFPIFAYKAIADEISPIADTDKLINKYCGIGSDILYQRNTVGGHSAEETNGDARAFSWLQNLLQGNGSMAPMGCVTQNVTINITDSAI